MHSDGAATEAEAGADASESRPSDERTAGTAAKPSSDAPVAREAPAAECTFCGQRVPAAEALAVEVGDAGQVSVCAFCADSLFEDLDVAAAPGADAGAPPDPTAGTGRERERTMVAPGEERSASAVSWTPPRPSGDGFAGAVLQAHFLSLSLLWAIHRTNVRLAERVLDEVDIQLVAVLGLTLAAVVATGVVLATALP